MKSKWFRLLCFLPLIIGLCLVNFYIDPATIFHDVYEEVGKLIVEGNMVGCTSENINERLVKKRLIQSLPEHVDSIAVGPSLVLGVRKECTGDDLFFNLGVSGADFYDILAQFALLRINGKKFDRVIFCTDTYFFDKNIYETATRNKELRDYSDYMIDVLDNKEPIAPNDGRKLSGLMTNIGQLFSISYFKSSVAKIVDERKILIDKRGFFVVDESYEQGYYDADGSWIYPIEYQNSTVDDVILDANGYDIVSQFSKGEHIDNYSKTTFEKLVQYLLGEGVVVELFLCPVSPTLYDRLEAEKNHYFVLDEMEEFVKGIGEKYGLKVTGSCNPCNLGMMDEDFYDARHIRHELLPKFFDFKE